MLRDIFDEPGHIEDHIVCPFILHYLTIKLEGDMQFLWIGDEGRRQQDRPHWQEAGRTLAQQPVGAYRLQIWTIYFVAARQVVDDGIAGDVVKRLRARHMPRRSPDNDAKLQLPVGLSAIRRQDNWIVWAGDGRRDFGKYIR